MWRDPLGLVHMGTVVTDARVWAHRRADQESVGSPCQHCLVHDQIVGCVRTAIPDRQFSRPGRSRAVDQIDIVDDDVLRTGEHSVVARPHALAGRRCRRAVDLVGDYVGL